MNQIAELSPLDLLRNLIRRPSPDPPGNERDVATFLADYLERRGFEVKLEEFLTDRFNILVRLRGKDSKPGLVFSAHMDTMPPGEQGWEMNPYAAEMADGKIYGRGACDMKSGLAAMVAAAERLRQDQADGAELSGDLVLAFTAGESSSCLGARRLAERNALRGCGAILVGEPSSLDLLSTEMGALWLRATALGRPGHGSGAEGRSAIDAMLGVLAQIPSALPGEVHPLVGPPTVSIGRIAGGTVVNMTAERCWAELDIRLPPGQDPAEIEAALAGVANGAVSFERIDYKPPIETSGDDPFLQFAFENCPTCAASRSCLRAWPIFPMPQCSCHTSACRWQSSDPARWADRGPPTNGATSRRLTPQ